MLGEFKDILVGQLCYAANTFQTAEGTVNVKAICKAVLAIGICPSLMFYAVQLIEKKSSRSHITKKLREWEGTHFVVSYDNTKTVYTPTSLAARAATDAAKAAHDAVLYATSEICDRSGDVIDILFVPPSAIIGFLSAEDGDTIDPNLEIGAPIDCASGGPNAADDAPRAPRRTRPWDEDASFTSQIATFQSRRRPPPFDKSRTVDHMLVWASMLAVSRVCVCVCSM